MLKNTPRVFYKSHQQTLSEPLRGIYNIKLIYRGYITFNIIKSTKKKNTKHNMGDQGGDRGVTPASRKK